MILSGSIARWLHSQFNTAIEMPDPRWSLCRHL
jgi:hypothetical protein